MIGRRAEEQRTKLALGWELYSEEKMNGDVDGNQLQIGDGNQPWTYIQIISLQPTQQYRNCSPSICPKNIR
jgi:hypothetical protein